ncbi:ParB N-terminal domain-containing protein [Sporosarcina thermotolerans]|uniref:ParB N-terminal domain-containing protein n=1 Tax=Sporosarcina thermotolerans TaxID=633404 RepID=UPI0024BD503A|nr:ParB N-terminal domain-containing protein [Sporosarcina thermotolerans]WHT48247.1 ParB N-terminal domain-containing protein [Sporosarcina thermotolerans]
MGWDVSSVIGTKYSSIIQHFENKVAWEDTMLFNKYKERLMKEKKIKGCTSINALRRKYEEEVDVLFNRIKKEGFLLPTANNSNIDVIHVYIDRNGNYLYTANGNHRLAFAKVLGIEKIPVKVRARHTNWEEIREDIWTMSKYEVKRLDRKLIEHPDLEDIIKYKMLKEGSIT